MISAGIRPLPDGLTIVRAPALPKRHQIRCSDCGCSVRLDHQPDSDDCRAIRRERDNARRQ